MTGFGIGFFVGLTVGLLYAVKFTVTNYDIQRKDEQ